MYKIKFNKTIENRNIKSFGLYAIGFIFFFCLIIMLPATVCALENNIKLPKGIIFKNGSFISEKDNMKMAFVSAGDFIMGSNNGNYNEKPEHKVYLDTYLIDSYEVSNAQFAKFVEKTGYNPQGPWKRGYKKGEENYPVRFVTWHDAATYAKWAGKRLPYEAEWEKAAKGKNDNIYPWGNTWYEKFAVKTEIFEPYDVKAFPFTISEYGCFGMAGGVWEWAGDWYDRFYYEEFAITKAVKNPTGPEDGAEPEKRFLDTGTAAGNERSTLRVIRGGGNWGNSAKDNTRAAKRMWGNPSYWFNDTGFRCAISFN